MNRKQLKGDLILLAGSFIWGLAFVAQDRMADRLGSFTINGIRFFIGVAALAPVILIMSLRTGRPVFERSPADRKALFKAGVICGVCLCVATNIQQFGLALYPDSAAASGRAGFITALYVVAVPLLGLIMRKKVGVGVWIGVALALVGMYLLCLSNGLGRVYAGDAVIFCCALAFSVQILCIDRFAAAADSLKMAALQFFVAGTLSLVLMFVFEKPALPDILPFWKEFVYLGVFSSGVAYTFQIVGQKNAGNPTVSSIIMSLESVFAAAGGAVLLNQYMSPRELIGCGVMFAAIVISQIPLGRPGTPSPTGDCRSSAPDFEKTD